MTDFKDDVLEVDLRSDTLTKPTPAMRKAMAEAVVGDDVYREDPTVIELEKMVAKRLGKEAALFVPTGTMGNLCAIMAHCWERGREAVVGDMSHINLFEQAGASQLAGVRLRSLILKPDGTFDLDDLREVICPNPNIHCCVTGLICLENTNNRCGGVTLSMEYVREVCRLAKSHGIPVHMDGARINNAAVYLGLPVATLVEECDSVSMCLSKGLGAPIGSVVAGKTEFIEKVLRCRKVLGGAMRQVGVIAAAGIVAFDGLEERLLRDHQHATKLAKAIAQINSPVVSVDLSSVHTNMVVLDFNSRGFTSDIFQARMAKVDDKEAETLGRKISVKISIWSSKQIRCVFHSDVSEADANEAIRKTIYVIEELTREYGKDHVSMNGVGTKSIHGLKNGPGDSHLVESVKHCKLCSSVLVD